MYVCLCNGYRESEIRDEALAGVRCVRTLYECLGNGPICGQCLETAQTIVDDVHSRRQSPVTAPLEALLPSPG